MRLIFNGAEPISVELADEFMARLAPARLKRTAMYPVYGLAEATLVVSFPQPPEQMYEHISVNRHELDVGNQPAIVAHGPCGRVVHHGGGPAGSVQQGAHRRR